MNKNIGKIAIIGLLLSGTTLNYITVIAAPMEQAERITQSEEESNSLEEVILNIQECDNNIEEKMDKLQKLQEELDAKSEEIKVNEENIESLEKEVEERDKLLAERLKEIENSGGLKVTPLKYIEAILNSENLLDAINNLNSIYRICKSDAKLIEETKEAKENLENTKEKIVNDKKKLEEEKAKLIKYIEENSELLNVTNGTIVPIELPDGISELAKNLINTAQRYLGVPYLWGGTTPSGFDCSGLMQYVFAKEKISIPRTSQEQQKASEPIDINDVEPGDLVFNKESDSTHVGMYIGNDRYIHAPHTGDVVKISTLSTSNMKYAGRVIDQ